MRKARAEAALQANEASNHKAEEVLVSRPKRCNARLQHRAENASGGDQLGRDWSADNSRSLVNGHQAVNGRAETSWAETSQRRLFRGHSYVSARCASRRLVSG